MSQVLAATLNETVITVIEEEKAMTLFVVEETDKDIVKRYDNVIALDWEGHKLTLTLAKKNGIAFVYVTNVLSINSN